MNELRELCLQNSGLDRYKKTDTENAYKMLIQYKLYSIIQCLSEVETSY